MYAALTLCREPWWIGSCLNLLYNIKKRYGFKYMEVVRIAPRFGVMTFAIVLAIAFQLTDLGVTLRPLQAGAKGINPFWKVRRSFLARLFVSRAN